MQPQKCVEFSVAWWCDFLFGAVGLVKTLDTGTELPERAAVGLFRRKT